jgi:hypothetical protein
LCMSQAKTWFPMPPLSCSMIPWLFVLLILMKLFNSTRIRQKLACETYTRLQLTSSLYGSENVILLFSLYRTFVFLVLNGSVV